MKKYKKLFHIDALDYYQFVTFRTHDSVDVYLAQLLNNKDLKTNIKQYQIDTHLDKSLHGAYLNGEILKYLYNFLKTDNALIYELISFVIMPNHVHILFKQTQSLANTIKVLKAKSAVDINVMLNRFGKFWASGYYDKVIRDEEHFEKVYVYIENNALKAGLGLDGRFFSVYDDVGV